MWPRRYGRRKRARTAVEAGRARFDVSVTPGLISQSGPGARRLRESVGGWRESSLSARRVPSRNRCGDCVTAFGGGKRVDLNTPDARVAKSSRAAGRGGQAIGCWNWSAAAVARRTLPAHRPGRLPGAFALKSAGNLVLKRASRLDAFSAYPFPTWLPGDAPSGTAGTPEVGPPQSSRTRGDPSQVSCAHGR